MLHLHIQKNNVVDRAVILQNVHPVRKDRHFKLRPVLPGIPPDILLQYPLHLRVILYDRHPDHDCTSLTTPLWNCYGSIIAQSRPVCQGALRNKGQGSPQLTTVDVNPYQLGMEAASQTINHIENPNLLATKIIVPHKLIPRESCCPPEEERH